MTDYYDIRNEIVRFLNESNINPYDLMRVGRDLCSCRTCKFFVQHYDKDGRSVDFGHCRRGNVPKSKKPDMQNCGLWELDRDIKEKEQ